MNFEGLLKLRTGLIYSLIIYSPHSTSIHIDFDLYKLFTTINSFNANEYFLTFKCILSFLKTCFG